jgi:REP element-mobilizing transposase RayT
MEKYLPRKPRLLHTTPGWVNDPEHFITICCTPRGKNQLCYPSISHFVFKAFHFHHLNHSCRTELLVLMPDHLHVILKADDSLNLGLWIFHLKHWLSRTRKINFQENFFDHRLRTSNSAAEKWNYINMNPVRAGLVKYPEHWPYRYTISDFEAGRATSPFVASLNTQHSTPSEAG